MNSQEGQAQQFSGDVPGYAFRWILQNANTSQLQIFLEDSFVELLSSIDGRESSESELRDIAVKLLDPREVLQSESLRKLAIECLPIEKARELANKLNLTGSANVYKQLEDIRPGAPLYSFFGLTAESESQRSLHVPSESTINASYGLYPHQRDIAARAWDLLREPPSKVVLHMPTGSGKTRTAMHIVARSLRERSPGVVVWLAHSAELLEQAVEEFEKCWVGLGDRKVALTRLWGDHTVDLRQITDGLVVAGLGKLNAVYSRDDTAIDALAGRVSLIVFDEAHQAIAPTYQRLVESLYFRRPNTALIGLTATPGRTWANIDDDAKLSAFFNDSKVSLKVDGYEDPLTYLIDEGYLARPRFEQLTVDSIDEIVDVSNEVEYTPAILNGLANNSKRNMVTIQAIRKATLSHRRIIVFGATVQHARILTGALIHIGIESLLITSETDLHTRENVIRRFKGNADTPIVLCNYGVLTTGFDAPKTSCAIIARPTKSLVLYSQMIGRATRGPKVGGNDEAEIFTVIDTSLPGFGDLVEAFTNWEDVWYDK